MCQYDVVLKKSWSFLVFFTAGLYCVVQFETRFRHDDGGRPH